jgi:hypothetical protein
MKFMETLYNPSFSTTSFFLGIKDIRLAGRKVGTQNGSDFRLFNKWEGVSFFQHKACRS